MELIIFILEIIGVIAFAISGAITAIKKKADIFGVVFLGVITAVGGGIIRDILVGHIPPAIFSNYIYVLLAIIVSMVTFVFIWFNRATFLDKSENFDRIINIYDAIGLGVFTVNGMNVLLFSPEYEFTAFLVIVVGLCTGTGGGIVRDVIVNDIPFVLRKRIYAVASLVGGTIYYILFVYFGYNILAMAVAMLTIVIIRTLASQYKWDLPKIKFDE